MSNFTFFQNAFYAICILKSFRSHISVGICSFFEFGTVSKWCIREWVYSLPHNKSVDLSKSKGCEEVNLYMATVNESLFDRLENTVGIRRKCWLPVFSPFPTMFSKDLFGYQSFPLFQQCSQKTSFSGLLYLKFVVPVYPIPTQCQLLTPLGNNPLENTVGKGENACNEQFLLFPRCFLPVWITFFHFLQI